MRSYLAVEDCEEYLVHLPTLTQLAAQAGLEMLYAKNFTDFFADECEGNVDLLERMKVLPERDAISEAEWEVASTYMVIAFRRLPEGAAAPAPQIYPNPGHHQLSEGDIIHVKSEHVKSEHVKSEHVKSESGSGAGKRVAAPSGDEAESAAKRKREL